MTNLIDRRAALSSIAATIAGGAALIAPCMAEAGPADDPEVFAALDRLGELRKVQELVDHRHTAMEKLDPGRRVMPALIARAGDEAIFKTPAPIGEPLDHVHVERARDLLHTFRICRVDGSDPLFGHAHARAKEVTEAEEEWKEFREAERERLGISDAEKAFNEAVSATFDAARDLLDLRPLTIAGLRAMVEALIDLDMFEGQEEGEALAYLLLEAPALGGEC